MGMFERFFKPNVEKMEKRRDVEGLIKALKHKDTNVREKTAKALGRIKDARALPILISMLGSNEWKNQSIAQSGLFEFGDIAIEPLLMTLFKTKSYSFWGAATHVLRRIAGYPLDSVHAVKALIRAWLYARERMNLYGGSSPYASYSRAAFSELVEVDYSRIARALVETIGPEEALKLAIEIKEKRTRRGDRERGGRELAGQIVSHVFEEHAVSCPLKLLIEALLQFKELNMVFASSILRGEAARKIIVEQGSEAVDPLLSLLLDPSFHWLDSHKASFFGILGEIGDERAVQPLLTYFNHIPKYTSQQGLVKDLARALTKMIGSKESIIKKACSLLESKREIEKKLGAFILSNIDWVPPKKLGAEYYVNLGDYEKCIEIGSPAVPFLVEELPRTRDALLKIANSDAEAREKVVGCILNVKGFETRYEHLYVLAKLGDKRAFAPLLAYALKGLEGGREPEDIEEMLIDLSHHTTLPEEVVKLALKAVSYWRDRGERFDGQLRHDADSLEALEILCRLKGPGISNILYKISQIEDIPYTWAVWVGNRIDWEGRGTLSFEEHKRIASEELAHRGFSTYNPSNYFTTKYKRRDVQAEVAKALRERKAQERMRMRQALKRKNASVRREAVMALGKLGDTWAVRPLIKALQDKDMDVRREAVVALARIGQPAVEPLIQALKDDEEYVRRKAVVALGEIGDARAVEPLNQALKREDLSYREREKAEMALKKIKSKKK